MDALKAIIHFTSYVLRKDTLLNRIFVQSGWRYRVPGRSSGDSRCTRGQDDGYFSTRNRTGSDVIKAPCLGAKVVLVGRPVIYGLSIQGRDGARQVL